MMNKDKQQNNLTKDEVLTDSVFSKIKKDKVRPTGRWVFFCSNCAVWMLWGFTIIVGAIAFAETIYIGTHSGIEFYEMTHGNLSIFIVESLPYVWIGAFIIMAILAHYNMRRTKRGYKYPMWQILLSSVVLTVVGGLALNGLGVSKTIDRVIGNLPMYTTVEERQEYLWTHPQDGRISGTFRERIEEQTEILFKDVVDRDWTIAIHELSPNDVELLLSGKKVRLLGEAMIEGGKNSFYGCGVLPWMPEGEGSHKSIKENRENLIQHIKQFTTSAEQKVDSGQIYKKELRCREIMEELMKN